MLGRKANHILDIGAMAFGSPPNLLFNFLPNPTKIPKTFRPKHDKSPLAIMKVESNVDKEGKNVWHLMAMVFLSLF